MFISAINSINQITPKNLLERFKKGERLDSPVEYNDNVMQELDVLAQQYKQSVSVEKKIPLLDKEREILYDELLKPELTLSRNYNEILEIMPPNLSPQEIEDTLRLFNITGIGRIEQLLVYKPSIQKENVEVLKKAYSLFDETTKSGNRGRSFVIQVLSSMVEENPKLKSLVQNTYDDLLKITKDEELRKNLSSKNTDFDTALALKNLKQNPKDTSLFRTLILKSPRSNNEVKEFLTDVLKNEKDNIDIIRTAILGGGKFRNDEIFDIISKIALDKTEKDIRKREFAIQSTALYLKDKPEEVKTVLNRVRLEKSEFSLLGRILLDKITGNYHGQKDRELNYTGFNKKQVERFKHLLKRYYQTEFPLNIRQENVCQLNTLPFRKQLNTFVCSGNRYFIQRDTYTKQALDYVAKRYFFSNAGIYNSGDYRDSFDGISARNYNMMSQYRVADSSHQNQMAHENGHTVHSMFDKKDMKTLTRLYNNAIRDGRELDYYAAANKYEYFAQGCDAFASIYKPHRDILVNSPLAHTVYELMDKDPDLFKFIKTVLKKYH